MGGLWATVPILVVAGAAAIAAFREWQEHLAADAAYRWHRSAVEHIVGQRHRHKFCESIADEEGRSFHAARAMDYQEVALRREEAARARGWDPADRE